VHPVRVSGVDASSTQIIAATHRDTSRDGRSVAPHDKAALQR
jgi:hypothetical protein